VVGGPLGISSKHIDVNIPMTATMGVVAVFVGDGGSATCQAAIMFNMPVVE